MVKALTFFFASGALGGFMESMAYWLSGKIGIAQAMGMPAHGWDPTAVYRPVVWGGIWGLIFVIPFLGNNFFLRGIILSIAPTLASWYIFIPAKNPHFHGSLSMLLMMVVLNAIWGIVTGFWLYLLRNS